MNRNKNIHNRTRNRAGFTLLEVVIAVTIVALLATLAVPKLTQFLFQANKDKATAACNSIAQGVSFYVTKNRGILPDDFNLDMLLEGDDAYLGNPNDLIDPWGNPYEIDIPGDVNGDFDVISLGPDGQRSDDDLINGSSG